MVEFGLVTFKEKVPLKNKHFKDSLLTFAEEVGAWLLLAGFLVGIFWLAGIAFGAQVN